jgi:hypothetical protein
LIQGVAMSFAELQLSVRALPRRDKFRLVQGLIAELAQEETVPEIEYPVWSPYDAHAAAAAATLLTTTLAL